MSYLSYLNIKKFRGISNLEIENLVNINIIVGDNNSGKTSLLESIAFLEKPDSIKNMLLNASRRDSNKISKFELFLEMFPKNQNNIRDIQIESIINNIKNELKIEGKISEVVDFNSRNSYFDSKVFEGYVNLKKDNEEILNKEIYIQENKQMRSSEDLNLIKIIYMTPYDHFIENMLNNTIEVIKEGDKDKIVKLLKLFDENIIGFEVLPNLKQNSSSIYINHKIYNLMPLSSFGDGVKKVLTLASGLINAKNGILLIDEIETAIYKDMINDVFKWFVKSCMEYNVQLICTTHSLEVIDSIVEGMGNNISKLACFRIETIDNDMNATRFSGSKLKDIRTILGQDVR